MASGSDDVPLMMRIDTSFIEDRDTPHARRSLNHAMHTAAAHAHRSLDADVAVQTWCDGDMSDEEAREYLCVDELAATPEEEDMCNLQCADLVRIASTNSARSSARSSPWPSPRHVDVSRPASCNPLTTPELCGAQSRSLLTATLQSSGARGTSVYIPVVTMPMATVTCASVGCALAAGEDGSVAHVHTPQTLRSLAPGAPKDTGSQQPTAARNTPTTVPRPRRLVSATNADTRAISSVSPDTPAATPAVDAGAEAAAATPTGTYTADGKTPMAPKRHAPAPPRFSGSVRRIKPVDINSGTGEDPALFACCFTPMTGKETGTPEVAVMERHDFPGADSKGAGQAVARPRPANTAHTTTVSLKSRSPSPRTGSPQLFTPQSPAASPVYAMTASWLGLGGYDAAVDCPVHANAVTQNRVDVTEARAVNSCVTRTLCDADDAQRQIALEYSRWQANAVRFGPANMSIHRLIAYTANHSCARARALTAAALNDVGTKAQAHVWNDALVAFVEAQLTARPIGDAGNLVCQMGFVRQLVYVAWWIQTGLPVSEGLQNPSALHVLSLRQLLNQCNSSVTVWSGLRTLVCKVKRAIMLNMIVTMATLRLQGARSDMATPKGDQEGTGAGDGRAARALPRTVSALELAWEAARARATAIDDDPAARPCKALPKYAARMRVIGYDAATTREAVHQFLSMTFKGCQVDMNAAYEDMVASVDGADGCKLQFTRLPEAVFNNVFQHSWKA